MVDERGGSRLAVGASDPDHFVRRQLRACPGEQLDIADDLHPRFLRAPGDRVAVERQARSDDDGVEAAQIAAYEIFELDTGWRLAPRLFLVVPRRDPGPAGKQGLDRRQAATRETQDSIMFSGEGPGGDHLSLRVESPASARMKLMIQNRITTVGSLHPKCSKWWWIGAILKMRLPYRLNQKTWTITLTASSTNSPPTMTSTNSWWVATETAPSAPPKARLPVSPMKTAAGGALNQRKARPAPTTASSSTVKSPAPGTCGRPR